MQAEELEVEAAEDLTESNFEKMIIRSSRVEDRLPGDKFDYAKITATAGAAYLGSKALEGHIEDYLEEYDSIL